MDVIIPTMTKGESVRGRVSNYEVIIGQFQIHVTCTNQRNILDQWVGHLRPPSREFYPVGVAVHTRPVLTLSIGDQCMIYRFNQNILSRDVQVFLCDVATCYGWGSESYNQVLAAINTRLSIGNITDICTLVADKFMLGDFAMDIFGQRVLEPNVVWPEINLKKNHIRETVLEAFICQQFGKRHPLPPTYAPGSSNYPQILNTQELENVTLYQVALSTSRTIDVTYTYKAAAAVSWLAGSGATLMGIDVQYLLYKPTTLALAYGEHTLVYNLGHGEKLPRNVFINYLDGGCRVVGLNLAKHLSVAKFRG
ncbi:unnamed protein product [Cochlearia groenlandica]